MMTSADVIEILDLLAAAGIQVWVDGGWGVDALLGEETRDHGDLDIAVSSSDEEALRVATAAAGFAETSAEPHNPVLTDSRGRMLDVHFVDFTVVREGPGWLVYGDISYDVGAFEGEGMIAGRSVPCTTVVSQLRSHAGYAFDEDDILDVVALVRHFGVDPPEAYRSHLEG